MDSKAATQWCQEQNGQLSLCAVLDIPGVNWEEEQIHQRVMLIAPEKRVGVVDFKVDQDTTHTYVLLEWRKEIPACFRGVNIKLTDDVEARLIQLGTLDTNKEGPSTSTVAEGVPVPAPMAMMGPEFIAALGDFMEKCQKNTSGHTGFGYRKLRYFSGNQPVPANEENFEEWLEQAMQALDEWDIPETQKKQRITESLKGPASEAIRNLKFSQKDCTAHDYLSILQDVFGRTEKISDLLYQFEHTYQKEGEKLSAYIQRLDKVLHQLILKKGLDPTLVDETRVRQVLRGAQPLDPIMLQLKTQKEKKNLTYPELIRTVREEEAMLEDKKQTLGADVRAEVRMTNTVDSTSEINLLKIQMAQIMEMLTKMTTNTSSVSEENTLEAKPAQTSTTAIDERLLRNRICYNCGGIGHYQRNCASPRKEKRKFPEIAGKLKRTSVKEPTEGPYKHCSNNSNYQQRNPRLPPRLTLVKKDTKKPIETKSPSLERVRKARKTVQRELKVPRVQQNEQRKRTHATKVPEERKQSFVKHHNTNRKSTDQRNFGGIPEGLVGPSPEISVRIEGIYGRAVLDTGAQITILYRDFYQKYLKHLPLQKLEALEIWGLSHTKFPYDGYVSIFLEFPATVVGSTEAFETLAVVCPRPREDTNTAILVGTNTDFVRRMLQPQLSQSNPSIHPALRSVFCALKQEETTKDDEVGHVWSLAGRELVIPPGRMTCMRATVKMCGQHPSSHFMIETASGVTLPPELQLIPEVWPASKIRNSRVMLTVGIKNQGSTAIILPSRVRLGSVYAVTPLPTRSQKLEEDIDFENVDLGGGLLSDEWMDRAKDLLQRKKGCFSASELDMGCAKNAHHKIRLREDQPFRERSRRIAPGDLGDLRKHLEELKATGIIQESRSPYASPIVVVRKKNGSIRMCVDYRTLNQRTIPDQYTTPRIEDALNCLVGSKWFSVLDLRSGYYQIPMHPDDKEKTAFICPLGFLEFNRMPQGLCGSPATFQRLMENTVGDMHLLEVLVYLDDIIVFGKTLEEHAERLSKVLDRLEKEGLKLSIDKCKFFQPSVTYVGHVVSAEGIATDPSKVSAVTTWPRPRTVTEVRSFLGFCGYYRRFVEGFSKIARPLNHLLQNETIQEDLAEGEVLRNPTRPRSSKENIEGQWTTACEQAFERLKHCLTHTPVLAYADSTKPFVLHVDASREGLGGVLYQEQDGLLKPIAFISRSLSPTEKNYPAHKLEFLALKWAVVDKLHDYLYGVEFEVQTDNNPLTYIQTTAKLDATGHRWMAALANYNFRLKYRPGNQNGDADGLSRRPHEQLYPEDDWIEIPAPGVRTMCQFVNCHQQKGCWARNLCFSEESVPKAYCDFVTLQASSLPSLSNKDLIRDQGEDPLCMLAVKALKEKQVDILRTNAHPLSKLLAKEWERLQMKNGVVYRRAPNNLNTEKLQLLLPQKHRETVLQSLHDDHGHLGNEKTLGLVRERFYWPCMKQDVEDYCRSCLRCIQRKKLPARIAPMGQMESSGPMELVCIDFLCIEPDEGGISNVLVVTDHYTRYAQAFPTKDQKAITVAKTLVEKFFVHYGLPKRIHSDQGRDFESRLVRELLTMLEVKKSRTTPYHPQGDPQPERFNRTLLDMLGTLTSEKKAHWSRHVATVVHAYNSTKNDATGFSPYFLMFGREARLPVDLAFGVTADDTPVNSHTGYVERLKRDLKQAYEKAEAATGRRHQHNKKNYDNKMTFHDLQPGDKVLLRNLGLHGKNKLADRWSSDLYVVCSQLPNIPVYQVRPDGKEGPIKTWHRNNMMLVAESVRKIEPTPRPCPQKQNSRRSRRLQRRAGSPPAAEISPTFLDEEDEDENEWGMDYMFCEREVRDLHERPLNVTAPEFIPALIQPQSRQEESEALATTVELEHSESLLEGGSKDCAVEEICSSDNEVEQVVTEDSPPDLKHAVECSENSSQELEFGLFDTELPTVSNPPGVNSQPRPQRLIKPTQRLTYDALGHSTQEAMTTSHRTASVKTPATVDQHTSVAGDRSVQIHPKVQYDWWEVPFDLPSVYIL